ncbi:MAG TPA: hypothetical protein VH374_14070 [Polyangia bacterium]|nr:hypothetical protein [Polyangia bacterium]
MVLVEKLGSYAEYEKNALDGAAKDAVSALSGLVGAAGQQRLAAATAALELGRPIGAQAGALTSP